LQGSEGDALGLQGGTRPETVGGEDLVIGGDIILKAQGTRVSDAADIGRIRAALDSAPPGGEINFTVLRGDRVVEVKQRRPK
jgi:hypothetical protein